MQILVIDQGTTSTRALLFTGRTERIASHQIEHKQYFPLAAWVEHDPEEIWSAVKTCCKKVLEHTDSAEPISLGITNQRETTLIWERESGKTLGHAIVWQDRRTAEMCHGFKKEFDESLIYQKTGLLIDPYFSATKIKWILDNHPGSRQRAKRGELLFGTVDCFLLWRLTAGKVHATDITNAARTLLFNIETHTWDEELIDLFTIPREMLPTVTSNCEHLGMTDPQLFGREIPIVAMMGDQQAAMIGQGCIEKGMAKCTYGTGCFLMVNTGSQIVPSAHKLLNTIAYDVDGKITYAVEGSIYAAGSIVKWFRDKLGIIKKPEETSSLAASLADNGQVYFVPAFTGLGAPYWNSECLGAIYNITRDTTAAHIVRAGLEAIAYQTKDLLQDDSTKLAALKVDGGVSINPWLMQFLADMLQMPIKVNSIPEATSLGVAYLVAYYTGQINTLDELISYFPAAKTYTPTMPKEEALSLYKGWLKAVARTLQEP